jgi:hypothetical protein
LCFDARPHPDLLPREKEWLLAGFVLWMAVRQIQSREFSEKRRTILLLLGEKAGMREVVNQRRTGRTRKRNGLVAPTSDEGGWELLS